MRLKAVAKQGVRVDAAAPCGKPSGHICLRQSHDIDIVYGPLLQLPRSFVKITNVIREGEAITGDVKCNANKPGEYSGQLPQHPIMFASIF